MAAPPDVAGFMYHEVTDEPWTSGFQRPAARPYQLTRGAFGLHLDGIAAAGATPSLVTAGSPTVVASPVAAASPPPSAETGGGLSFLVVAALIGLGGLIGIALMASRRPRPRR